MNREQRRAANRIQRGRGRPLVARKVWSTEIDTIQHAIEGAAVASKEKLDKLATVELLALDSFIHGSARMQEWSVLANVNNMVETLAGMGIGTESMPDCKAAEAALVEAAERYQRTKRMGLSGQGIQAVRHVLEWHELQRSSISSSQYWEAIRLTDARIKSGHATIDLEKTLGKPLTT
jgi:hypothetical protein